MKHRYYFEGPEGQTHREGFDDLHHLVRHVLAWGIAMGKQGYYRDMRCNQIPLEEVIDRSGLRVEEVLEELEGLDEDHEAFVLWLPALTAESFEYETEADDEIQACASRGVKGMKFSSLEELTDMLKQCKQSKS